jgi:peroxiredoxin
LLDERLPGLDHEAFPTWVAPDQRAGHQERYSDRNREQKDVFDDNLSALALTEARFAVSLSRWKRTTAILRRMIQTAASNLSGDSSRASGAAGSDFNQSQNSGQFRMPSWGKAAIFFAVIALASVGYITNAFFQKPAPIQITGIESDAEEIAKREPVQDFILTDAEGKQKKLSEYRGNVVILSFWASWCTPCLVELPTFGEIEKRLHDKGLRVLAINVDEGDEGKTFAKDMWAKKQFTFPSYFDGTKTIAQQFDVEALPSNFVIDRQGRVAFSGFGANDWANPQTVEFIESLLAESATADAPPVEAANAAAPGAAAGAAPDYVPGAAPKTGNSTNAPAGVPAGATAGVLKPAAGVPATK